MSLKSKIAVFCTATSIAVAVSAQNFPFPQHVSYAAGIKPNNVSQSSMDSTVSSYWSAYAARYIKSASTGGYYIAYNLENQGDPGAATVSEAHGYGMVLCAYMGDKTHFDGMYTYYKNHPSQNNSYLMAWEQNTSFVDMNGADSATDGDMDIAYSLLLADKQWGSSGSINYLQAATNMINALMQSDVNQTQWTLRLGDWATSGTSQGYADATATRPSDFMFDHMRSYMEATGDTRWTNVISASYSVVNSIFNNYSSGTGLIPDFVVYNGSSYLPAPANFLEGATDGEYNYNSCRTPWRFSTEYMLRGTSGILTETRKMNSWIQSSSGGNPNNVFPGYTLSGTALNNSYTDDSFTSPFAVCSMTDSGNQSWLNSLWTWIAARTINTNDGYFGNSITMQSVIVLSGNWWKPSYTSGPTPDFTVSATPSSQTVTAGNNTSYTVNLGNVNGFTGTVTFSASGLPTGATAAFNPTSSTSPGSSSMTVTTSSSTPAGTYIITVTGTSGSLQHSATVTLIVNGSGLTWTEINDTDSGITYSAGWGYSTNRNDGDYNNDVHYTKTNGNYAQYTFNGTGVEYITETYSDEGNVDIYIDGTLQTTVNCNSSTRAAQVVMYSNTSLSSGSHTIKAVKNGGTYMLLDAFAYTAAAVPNFSVSASPSSQTVTAGNGTSYTATITPVNGFGGTVNMSVSGLPSGASGSFNPTSVSGSGTSTLSVTTATSTAPGTYTLTITGVSGNLTNSTMATLVVSGTPDFSISASPSSQTVTAGNGTSYTATTSALNGFSGSVNLSVSGLPSGASASFNPASVTGSGSSTLTITTTSSMPTSTSTLTITGTSGSLQHSATVTLTVNAVSQTWTEINDTDSGITYSAGWNYGPSRGLGDFDDDVHYTTTNGNYAQYTFNGTGVEYITETYSDEGNVDIYIDGTYQTTVNCNSSTRQVQVVAYSNTSLSAGSHTIKVVKNGGTYMLVDAFAYTTTSTPDFSISATPSSQSVTPGNSTSYTATASALNGFNGAVSFTVSGLPTGASGTFNPTSVTGSGSSTLSVTTSGSTPTGTYTVTVTGTSGSLVHSATVTLVVSSANSNIAPSGTAYGWSGMTSSTANTGKAALPGLNDNNLTVDVDIQPNGDNVNAWEAAGVIWSSTKSISSVDFINGTITSGGDGFLTASLKLQFSTDGSTWTDSGWTVSPAYPYSSLAGGQTYTFSGTAVSGMLGARVIGQVRTTDTSYHWIVKEVQITGH